MLNKGRFQSRILQLEAKEGVRLDIEKAIELDGIETIANAFAINETELLVSIEGLGQTFILNVTDESMRIFKEIEGEEIIAVERDEDRVYIAT